MIPAMLAGAHRAVDAFAIWTEDRVRREPQPCRLAAPDPLDCFGPLPPLPGPPPPAGTWSVPSPRPAWAGDRLVVHAHPARGTARGVVLLVPPWKLRGAGPMRGWIRLVTDAGLDAWMLVPPHHLERVAPGARSGEAFVSLDLPRVRASLEQLVLEIRLCAALAAAVRRSDGTDGWTVGLVGLSLGALAAALAATAAERVDQAALIAPPDLTSVVASTGVGRRYRRLAALAGSPWPTEEALAAALAPLDPASRAPTARRLFVAAALHDAIAPPAGALRLAHAWGVAPAVYPRGHITLLFGCRRLREDLRRFLLA